MTTSFASRTVFFTFLTVLLGGLLLSTNVHAEDHTGIWTKKSQSIKGSWAIVETADGFFLELDDGFKTRNAPDLKLFLSRTESTELTAKNATSNSVLISKLEKPKGAQRYRLPDDIDPADFKSLLLHCEQYTKLWGVSAI